MINVQSIKEYKNIVNHYEDIILKFNDPEIKNYYLNQIGKYKELIKQSMKGFKVINGGIA